MGNGLYVEYWKNKVGEIISCFKGNEQQFSIDVSDIANYGNRSTYRSNFIIYNNVLYTPKSAHAQGRDFHEVFINNDYYKTTLIDKRLRFTLDHSFNFNIELLPVGQPDFFNEEDFEQLEKYAGEWKNDNSDDHKKTYDYLKNVTYVKVEYWADCVLKKCFPGGRLDIRKRTTNQASNFEYYQWAKIYPGKEEYDFSKLAFTVDISTESGFTIKVDTVGLNDSDPNRVKYIAFRGDHNNSQIVSHYKQDDILTGNWNSLIDLSVNDIKKYLPLYYKFYKEIGGIQSNYYKSIIERNMNLNTILYDPPGTGKTFNTVNVALQIADPIFYKANESDRDKLVERFNQLLVQNWDIVDGQIGFITFHQNYSYEEFVQGLRPDLSEYSDGLAFELRDGIFKKLADRALANKEAAKNSVQIAPTFDQVFEDFFREVIEHETAKTIKMETEGYSFDVTKYNPTQKNFNFKKKDGGTGHNIYVPTLKALYEGSRADIKGLRSYYLPLVDAMKERAKEMVKGEPAEELKNYVLIIDEINRANISRVFGELITLIETDKRWGAKHQLRLTLPSGDRFTVPDNLYIVGTMNTADKSLALLDIALRRRFSFLPKYPDDKNVVEEAKDFFNKLNEIIFKEKSADFTIGHSYFMKPEDEDFNISATMNENVIPLLQEYFYSSKPGTVKSIINSALEGTPLSKYEVVDTKYGQLNFTLKNG